jgi:phage repressor protein C with HTH and peptisase S24 domain/DNA-binding XRE family transcriptional regulator
MIDLKLFRKEQNVKQSDLCVILDITQPYLSSIENGKRPLNEEKLNILYSHYGDVVLKYKQTDRPIILSGVTSKDSIITIDHTQTQDHIIKYYDVEATAGNVEVFDDAKATYKNIVIPGFDDCDFALNVLGDSMYPELKSGQIAILKEWKEPYIEFGHTYMVVTKTGHRMIKRLRSSKQKDEVICESANEIYDSFELKKEDINKLFLVKGHVERSAI